MIQLRTLQVQLRRLFGYKGLPSRLLSRTQFRKAAVRERMRIYRNNSNLAVALFSPQTTSDAGTGILEQCIFDQIEDIDSAGWSQDDRIGILLPDYIRKDADKLAKRVVKACSAQDLIVDYELVCYPDDSIVAITGDSKPELQSEPATSVSPSTAASFFAIPLPMWKRAIDVLVSLVALTLASPVLLISAFMIKLTSTGTVFFSQPRTGHGGETFLIRKLRTMQMGADKVVDDLRHLSDRDGPAFKLNNDPRVLPLGGVLRKLSIDELPQLWNVLVGDMTLVGPRPLPTSESDQLSLWQRERLDVKPGITGPWQVSGRNNISFDQWMRMDIEYVRNMSPWRDLKILLFTVPAVALCRGAS